MLTDICLPELANQRYQTTGLDSYEHCIDKQFFLSFPYQVSYCYNSRGFRDREWPEDLSEAVWCVGDSFTVGLGLPFELTWPQLLYRNLDQLVITIAMDGASNQWISRRALDIKRAVKPKNMIIM